MKWFKLSTDLRQDERVAEYLDLAGDRPTQRHEAFGFLLTLYSFIAARMTVDEPAPTAHFRLKQWARWLDASPRTVTKLCALAAESRLIDVEASDDLLRVTVPKLTEWADQYYRKSTQSRDSVATQVQDTRPDKTSEQEITAEETPSRSESGVRWPGYISAATRAKAQAITRDEQILAEALSRHREWATRERVPLQDNHAPAQAGYLTTLRNTIGLQPEDRSTGGAHRTRGGPASAHAILDRLATDNDDQLASLTT